MTRDNFEGRRVLKLEYEAYPEMAVAEMKKIGNEIVQKWPDVRIAMIHTLGIVPVGEASVVIAVSSPHRDAAYAASRHGIDTLKARVPIWKKEIYQDGESWKANKR